MIQGQPLSVCSILPSPNKSDTVVKHRCWSKTAKINSENPFKQQVHKQATCLFVSILRQFDDKDKQNKNHERAQLAGQRFSATMQKFLNQSKCVPFGNWKPESVNTHFHRAINETNKEFATNPDYPRVKDFACVLCIGSRLYSAYGQNDPQGSQFLPNLQLTVTRLECKKMHQDVFKLTLAGYEWIKADIDDIHKSSNESSVVLVDALRWLTWYKAERKKEIHNCTIL